MEKSQVKARKKARKLIMQALYQWSLTGDNVANIHLQFCADNDMQKVDEEYFAEVFRAIPVKVAEIDSAFTPYLDRKLNELNPVELAIIRLGSYELMERIDVPYRVAINEAVSLARDFGAEDGHKYVNGVLDKVASVYRTVEVKVGGARE